MYLLKGGSNDTAVWAVCGQTIAKASVTQGGLYTSVIGYRTEFKDHPFEEGSGRLGTVYILTDNKRFKLKYRNSKE